MLRFTRVRWACLAATVLSLTVIGCSSQFSSSSRFGKSGKVDGKLTFAGTPVKAARIQLASKNTGVAVLGQVQGGEFKLQEPVPVGEYKVVVLTPQEPNPQDGVPYTPVEYADIPMRYRDEFNSDLTATVKEGIDNHLVLDMQP